MLSIHPPALKGKSGIMHMSDVLVDKNRKDPYSDLFERNLALDIWLPTDQPIKLVHYDERALNFWRKAEFWTTDQKKILEDELCKFGQYSILEKNISLACDSLPVVIFSHGFGAWASFYSYIIEEIVSHDITVIGINHTYQAGIAEFPQQTIYGKMSHSDLFQSRYADREQSLMIQD